ncbi:MAG: M48 family metallopeptidase [Pseudomonadota bacterium]|nr:M48 family metallopeptidase [Pseudomonadota bacterium]
MATTTAPTPAPTAPRAARVRAQWFDGRSSRARPAHITLLPGPRGPDVLVTPLDAGQDATPEATPLRVAHRDVGWPESWSQPRAVGLRALTLDLHAHGSALIEDIPAWHAAVAAAGRRASLAERMQTQWRVLLTVLVLSVVGLWAFYRWGTPWAATQLTRVVPLGWEQKLGEEVMAQIDRRYFKPSALPAKRQAELRAGFDKLAAAVRADTAHQPYRQYAPPLTLHFRSGLGANAFALPGGTVVMTDDIVEAADRMPGTGDAALLGVLAHEIGHVAHRHTTRMVVEQGVLNIGLGLALGDVSTLISTGASVLTGLSYTRGHERQADCYAVNLMRASGMPVSPMGTLLLGLSREDDKAHGDEEGKDGNQAKAPADAAPDQAPTRGMDWFSTHPDTAARAERLRTGDVSGCKG